MPSKEELKHIFGNRKTLREAFALLNSGGLSGNCLQEDAFYWSSSEYGYNYGAWYVSPSDGYMSTYDDKVDSRPVRCVLAF